MTSYTIIGPGAVGLLYGGRLQEAGHDVVWVSSDPDAFRANGVVIEADGRSTRMPAEVVAAPADARPADVVLVALKATANHALADLVAPAVAEGATVALFQNGLGGEDVVRAAVPQAGAIVGGLCFVCAERVAHGHVVHHDYGPVELGEHGASEVTPIVEQIAGDVEAAGFDVTCHADLVTARWRKLVWNIPYNGLCAVLGTDTAAIMADPDAIGLVTRLMSEVVEAGRACGADPDALDEDFATGRRDMTVAMTAYEPSMKLDLVAGRPLEVEAIYDRPLAAAQAAGAPMASVRVLRDQLRFLDRG